MGQVRGATVRAVASEGQDWIEVVSHFPWAAATNYHELGGLKQPKGTLSSERQMSEITVSRAAPLLKAEGKDSSCVF